MSLWKFIPKWLLRDEDGAVTVDWVLVTAAVALLSIPVLTTIKSSVQVGTDDVASRLEENVERDSGD